MGWFQKFMYGRNGIDRLNLFLLVAAIVVYLLSSIFGRFFSYGWLYMIFWLLGLFLLCWTLFRSLSRNLAARQKEEARFERFLSWLKRVFHRPGAQNGSTVYTTGRVVKDKDHFKYFKCPDCHQKIRIPKGRGKVQVHCPKCGRQFIKRT